MTRSLVHSRAVSGEIELLTPAVAASWAWTCFIFAWFAGVNTSRMLWPAGTSNAVSMASPPKRSWYARLSLAIWESLLR